MAKIVNLTEEIHTFQETHPAKQAFPIEYYIDSNSCFIPVSHAKDRDGYPRVFRGKDLRMSRYVWETYNQRKIPKDLLVLHKCDNPHCINPNHLHLGTQKQNMAEMVRRGRSLKGSNHPKAKLIEKDVYFIRFESEGITRKELAEMFEVSKDTIRDIKKNKSWKHVTKDMKQYSSKNNQTA